MNIGRSTLAIFGARASNALVSFLGLTFYARELGASALGLYFVFQAVIGLLSIPANFGIAEALQKRISEGGETGRTFASGLALLSGALAALTLGVLVFRSYITSYLGEDLILLLLLTLWVEKFGGLFLALIRGELRIAVTAPLEFIKKSGWVLFGFPFVIQGFGARGLIYGALLSSAVVLVLGVRLSETHIRLPTWEKARSLFDYSRYSFFNQIGIYTYSWVDTVVIGFFLTDAFVGRYEIAWRLTSVVLLFTTAIATTIFPHMSSWSEDDEESRIESVVPIAVVGSLLFVIPSFYGVMVFSEEILGLLFGPEYAAASLAMIIVIYHLIPLSVASIFERVLGALDRPDLVMRATIASAVINLVLDVLLVRAIGIEGAALGTTIAWTVMLFTVTYYLRQYLTVDFPLREVSWCVAASIVMVAVLVGLRSFVMVTAVFELLGLIVVGALVYFSVVMAYGPLRTRIVENSRRIVSS